MPLVQTISIIIMLQRVSELALSARNTKRALARGGIEHGRGHYWMFVVLHVGWLVGINAEWQLGHQTRPSMWPWLCLGALLLQVARYSVIRSLGEAWNTRIITWPDMTVVRSGWYRHVRHPNYLIVALELALVPMIVGCFVTAVVASVANAAILLLIRIPAEERALAKR
jgi:methyltransferase